MKIRYYLRGLGLGILVTAIFFMVSGKSDQAMSDEMIKARARELGMSESVVLADLSKQEEEIIFETTEVEMTEVSENTATLAETETIPQYYVVQQGDTLRSICISVYGDLERVEEVCLHNGIANPDSILCGQTLLLP